MVDKPAHGQATQSIRYMQHKTALGPYQRPRGRHVSLHRAARPLLTLVLVSLTPVRLVRWCPRPQPPLHGHHNHDGRSEHQRHVIEAAAMSKVTHRLRLAQRDSPVHLAEPIAPDAAAWEPHGYGG